MLLNITYVIGITAEAMTAALSAGRQRFDLFGVLVLACCTAFGGGVVRDVLLNHYPLKWVDNPLYLAIVLVAALGTVSLSFLMKYFSTAFLLADAVGLCAFSVLGTRVALEMGYGFLIATVASVATGVFGGVLRDLLSDRVPLVFQKDLYASVSVGITAMYMGLLELEVPENWIIILTLAAGIVARLTALHFGIGLPVFEYVGDDQQMDPRLRRGAQVVRRGIRGAGRKAERGIAKAERGIKDAGRRAEAGIKTAGRKAEQGIKGAALKGASRRAGRKATGNNAQAVGDHSPGSTAVPAQDDAQDTSGVDWAWNAWSRRTRFRDNGDRRP